MAPSANPLELGPRGGNGNGLARAATIYDVAQAAGVSHQTVSRYLKGFTGIRPETRAKVERALDDLGYRPNLTARSLKSGRSHRIGALTHDISHVGPSRIAEGASAAAREAGYVLDLISLDVLNPRAIEESLALVTQHELAGILALASTDEMAHAFETTDFRVPAYMYMEPDDTVSDEPSELAGIGVPALIDHLVALGHRSFVHIAGPGNWSASRNRIRAFEAVLDQAGFRPAGVLVGDWSARSGYQAVAELPELPEATAYLAANDQMALGAMLALKERGLRVPEDVSVVGIDDIPEAAYFDPPLTSIHVDFDSRGRNTLQTLLARIEGSDLHPVVIPAPQLVVRR
jgi:DNA-binding LacI/PurR family transcriptional regulator